MPEKFKVSLTNVHTLNCFQFLRAKQARVPGHCGRHSRQLHTLSVSRGVGAWSSPMHPGLPSYPSGRSRIPPRKRTGKSGGKPSTLAPATLPLQSPQQAAWHSPRFSQGPMVHHRLENPTAKALWAQHLARRPPTARGGFRHQGTSRRQTPTSARAPCRAGNGEERKRTQHARNPAMLPLKSPQLAASRPPRCPLARGPTVPEDPRRPKGCPI